MGPLTLIGRRTLQGAFLFSTFVCATSAQTSPFAGHCQVTSTPLRARSEGVTEKLGDLNLQCSSSTPNAVFSGNLTLFFPVSVTNRVDASNLTHDAVVSVDSGSGFAPLAVAGTVSGNNISFNGITFTIPANGLFTLRISGVRANASQLGSSGPVPPAITALISSSFAVDQSSVIMAYAQRSFLATLYTTGITCAG